MAKDSLTEAIFELKDKGRRTTKGEPTQSRTPSKQAIDERPRAFDTFHTFSLTLLVFGLILQIVALALYA